MQILFWVSFAFIMIETLTSMYDMIQYKVWDKDKWYKHMEYTIKDSRSQFKHKLHRRIYAVLVILLTGLELVAYVMITQSVVRVYGNTYVLVIIPVLIYIMLAIRNIGLINKEKLNTSQLSGRFIMVTVLMMIMNIYNIFIAILVAYLKVNSIM